MPAADEMLQDVLRFIAEKELDVMGILTRTPAEESVPGTSGAQGPPHVLAQSIVPDMTGPSVWEYGIYVILFVVGIFGATLFSMFSISLFVQSFLVEGPVCCGGAPRPRSQPPSKEGKRLERARLRRAREMYRERYPPEGKPEKPSHARRRRQAQAIADLEQPQDVWLAGLLKDLAEIDEHTVRKGAEEVMRDLYLTPQQRRAHPHRLGKRR